ncbi:MAG: Na+/H+ antiporter subunit E [Ignavibacteriales bacterium]|nr:Na+/H+ antiporter subunit E [Ignavibacteriales bacterium]MCF8317009.1 Na+/H+ antiporter subunit E [Ignavibacteriales bacterium]MCF8438607.1 Na+/H+ antiporter subunit E [Ignavibacteriales bacterium]
MKVFMINILLAFIWIFLNGVLTPINFFEGFIIGFIIIWLTGPLFESSKYVRKVPAAIHFLIYFIYELIKANLIVAYDVITPRHRMNPGIVAVPLDVKSDFEILLLANLITLTPGTLSLDVSNDKKVLYVHSMYLDDPDDFRKSIKNGIEKRVLGLLR